MTYYTIYLNLTNFYTMIDKSFTSSKLIKYAIDYLSKYSSSKANLEKILRNKIRRLKIEKKEKYLLYNSLEKIIFDLEKNHFVNDLNYAFNKYKSLKEINSLIPYLKNDKKNNDEKINFILLNRIGKTTLPNKYKISIKELRKHVRLFTQ